MLREGPGFAFDFDRFSDGVKCVLGILMFVAGLALQPDIINLKAESLSRDMDAVAWRDRLCDNVLMLCILYVSLPPFSARFNAILLPDARNHCKLLRLVFSAQLFPVPLFLLLSPERHLAHSDRNEERSAPVPVHQQDSDPSHALKSVVRASNVVETETSRHTTVSSARTAQVAQRQVGGEVGELTEDVQSNGGVSQERRGVCACGRGQGRVSEVCDQHAGEQPVVGGVLEDVEEGHGCEGEAVDEEGLELAFDKVEHDHPEGEGLEGRRTLVEGRKSVNVWAEVVEDRMDQEGSEVFDDEDGTPGDLWT